MPSVSCNYKCEYCYLQGKTTKDAIRSFRSEKTRTAQEWIDGLEWLSKYWNEITSVDITGGEPFLYPNMTELAQKIIDRYGSINITSNLSLLPGEFFSLDSKKVGITVSAHLDENGKLRKEFIEKMIKLRSSGFNFVINFVAYPKQIKKYDKIINIAQTLNRGRHLEPYIDYDINPTDFGKFKDEYDEIYFNDNISDLDRYGIQEARKRGTSKIDCGVASKYIVVVENGDFYPCFGMMFLRDLKLGNIFDKTLVEENRRYIKEPIKCTVFCPCANNFRDGIR